ncbi:tyrosine-type recombinase/integrase [Halocatena halophila]|uniref:tyrosine-type recombinase/integrase n=1 Tax=Halocatena halophila TaxID=2814576 RepID=UPI002ED107D7
MGPGGVEPPNQPLSGPFATDAVYRAAYMPATKPLHQLIELFNKSRRNEVAASTYYNNSGHLNTFLQWCENNNVETSADLDGITLLEYKIQREEEVSRVTVSSELSTLRVFFRFCAKLDAVSNGFAENVPEMNISKNEMAKDDDIDVNRLEDILEYCEKFEYATHRHVIILLFWHTGMRLGSLSSLDVGDYNNENGRAYLYVRHRPETGTRLKNGEDGERDITISSSVSEVVDDYLSVHRHDVTDENGREPFITSKNGRLHKTAITKKVYSLTRPCHIGKDCPHDRDPEDCEATSYKEASKCPSSTSPHPLRRSAITFHLNAGWETADVSGRMNVSSKVLELHYNNQTHEDKRKQRESKYFD